VWIPAFVLVAALVVALPAVAQDRNNANLRQSMTDEEKHQNPKILVIYKEDVKPGRGPTHEKVEASFAQAYEKIDGARPYLAMVSVTGPTEAWFMEPANSFKELEAEMHATDNAPAPIKAQLDQIAQRESNEVAASREIITIYREDLSYKPEFDLPHSRYVQVFTFHVRPGRNDDFVEAAKLVRATHEKVNDGMQWAVYQAASGAPAGTFYVFRPVDSLEKIDPTDMTYDKAYQDALGKDGQAKLNKLSSEGYLSIETAIFAFNPKISYAPKAFAAADSFWAPKGVQTASSVGTSGKGSAVRKTGNVKKEKK
jgi:hypothetical protein